MAHLRLIFIKNCPSYDNLTFRQQGPKLLYFAKKLLNSWQTLVWFTSFHIQQGLDFWQGQSLYVGLSETVNN